MKIGYSNLLGEYVKSSAVVHKDCERFQIVCPVCREPIFKVERPQEESDTLHYLSHYPASRAHASDCELRVGKISSTDMERDNRASRDQKLRLFLRVLQAAVLKQVFGSDNRNTTKRTIRSLQKSKTMSFVRGVVFDHLEHTGLADNFDELAVSYYEDAGQPETAYMELVQRRIARDMLLHISSGTARPSYDFLFNVGMIVLINRLQTSEDQGVDTPFTRRFKWYASNIAYSTGDQAKRALAEANADIAYPPNVEAPMSYISKLTAEVHHEMIGILLSLPYFEIVRESKATI